ncbi:MAG: SoxR reducing system RseC family protein [Treponema sp.]|nr:SoxR reducing system RseC family protein [Treponema sp.]
MIARVLSVSGKDAVIIPGGDAACFGCLDRECKKHPSPVAAENRRNIYIEPGLLVETGVPAAALFREISTAVLPLLLGFIAGYFLAGYFFPSAAEASRAAAGLLLLFISAAAAFLVRRRRPAKTRLEIRRVISGPGA